MREIKFRGWDKISKEWFSGWFDSDRVNDTDDGEKNFTIDSDGTIILEQFTGLRDKNGCDIYEGDILQSVGAHRDIERIAIVSWCEEDAVFEAMPVGCIGVPWHLGSLNPRFWQIIGNIHENPELIEASHA